MTSSPSLVRKETRLSVETRGKPVEMMALFILLGEIVSRVGSLLVINCHQAVDRRITHVSIPMALWRVFV